MALSSILTVLSVMSVLVRAIASPSPVFIIAHPLDGAGQCLIGLIRAGGPGQCGSGRASGRPTGSLRQPAGPSWAGLRPGNGAPPWHCGCAVSTARPSPGRIAENAQPGLAQRDRAQLVAQHLDRELVQIGGNIIGRQFCGRRPARSRARFDTSKNMKTSIPNHGHRPDSRTQIRIMARVAVCAICHNAGPAADIAMAAFAARSAGDLAEVVEPERKARV